MKLDNPQADQRHAYAVMHLSDGALDAGDKLLEAGYCLDAPSTMPAGSAVGWLPSLSRDKAVRRQRSEHTRAHR